MFHHLAPIGLPQASAVKTHRNQHNKIEETIERAIGDINATNSAQNHKMMYNLAHPDTGALVKAIDAFFSHGLLRGDKCYWLFVGEFVPSTERIDLKMRWNCKNKRMLSLAWLKEALNRANLHFQMLSFISCPDSLKRAHYDKNACMRNLIMLKRICLTVDQLSTLEFHIEPPYVFRSEDTPIALPILDGTMSPIGSSNSSVINVTMPNQPNSPLSIHRRSQCQTVPAPKSFGGPSYSLGRNSSFLLDELVSDLPEVDLSTFGTSVDQHTLQSNKDQSYILDQMLRSKRKSFTNGENFAEEDEEEEREGEKQKDDNKDPSHSSVASYVPEDPKLGPVTGPVCFELANEEVVQQQQRETKARPNYLPAVPSGSSSLNSSELMKFGEGASSTKEDDGLFSELGDQDQDLLIEGEIILEGSDKIKLCLEVCVDDGEIVQHLFQVFIGHAAGQPLARYLLLTNKFVYLLAADKTSADGGFDVVDNEKDFGGISPASAVLEEWPAEMFEQNLSSQQSGTEPSSAPPQSLQKMPNKFETLSLLPLCDLDHLAVGIDAQVLCFHSKRRKFRVLPSSGHEQRLLAVETGSRLLGKAITVAMRRCVEQQKREAAEGREREGRRGSLLLQQHQQHAEAEVTEAGDELNANNNSVLLPQQQQQRSLCISNSHLGLVLKRFLRNELGIQHPEIVHHSLVYWHQSDAPQQRAMEGGQ